MIVDPEPEPNRSSVVDSAGAPEPVLSGPEPLKQLAIAASPPQTPAHANIANDRITPSFTRRARRLVTAVAYPSTAGRPLTGESRSMSTSAILWPTRHPTLPITVHARS